MNKDQTEEYIEAKMDIVDAKLKSKYVFVFRDGKPDDERVLATTSYNVNPCLITFYTDSIIAHGLNENQIDNVITHEIIHACFRGDEHDAYGKMREINIFQ